MNLQSGIVYILGADVEIRAGERLMRSAKFVPTQVGEHHLERCVAFQDGSLL
jgi:hypothetical protein